MPKYPLLPGWENVPGTARQKRNIATGEILSRTAYDRDYGRLKQQGIRSPQKQAKMSAPEVRTARPAPGRSSAKTTGALKLKGLKPLKDRIGRNINIPFDVFYTGSEGEFIQDARRFQPEYDLALHNIEHNSKIDSFAVVVDFYNERNGTSRPNTVLNSISSSQATKEPDAQWDSLIDAILADAYPGDHYFALSLHVTFNRQFVERSKRPKRKLKTKRKNKK